MRAVILQPMYLPWMGYFGLVDIADVFVFYDDVQFVRRSWQARNRIKTSTGEPRWLTIPVTKGFGQNINEAKINNSTPWKRSHWDSIRQAYGRTSFFREYGPRLEPLYQREWQYLADVDIRLTKEIASALELNHGKFEIASKRAVCGDRTERLINLLESLSADEYVSGPAAAAYIDVDKFREAGIVLYWYRFEHPVYPQLWGNFVPYLSVIDLIFNVGSASLRVIRDGARNALQRDPRT